MLIMKISKLRTIEFYNTGPWRGARTLTIMTFSIMTLYNYAECHVLFIVTLNVIMVCVVTLNVVVLSVVF